MLGTRGAPVPLPGGAHRCGGAWGEEEGIGVETQVMRRYGVHGTGAAAFNDGVEVGTAEGPGAARNCGWLCAGVDAYALESVVGSEGELHGAQAERCGGEWNETCEPGWLSD
jgi:hypothetical protein